MFLWNHQPTFKRCQFSKLSLQKRANSDISSFPPPKMLNAAYKNVKLVEMNRPTSSSKPRATFTIYIDGRKIKFWKKLVVNSEATYIHFSPWIKRRGYVHVFFSKINLFYLADRRRCVYLHTTTYIFCYVIKHLEESSTWVVRKYSSK